MAERRGTLGTLGSRIASFTGILAAGSALVMVVAIVRIAVLTRLLDMPVYGELTLLVIFAGFVAMLCRMIVVTGSVLSALRGGDDEGAEEEEEDVADEAPKSPDESRRVLGTGLVAALSLTVLVTALVALLHEPLGLVLRDSGEPFPLIAAAALGGLDASFHLVATIARLERRPVMFVCLQVTHAILGILGAVAFILLGHGLSGAIAGLALGSLIAIFVAFAVNGHRFKLAFHREYLRTVIRRGSPLILITVGNWLFRHADIIMVSRYLDDTDVAIYRVASRIGGITSTVLGGVLLARGPLMKGPMRGALRSQGLLVAADSRVVSYVWLISVWMLVGLFLMRDVLVMIAPPGYEEAATLIPLLGFAALAATSLTITYRTSRLRKKRRLLVPLLLAMTPFLIFLSIILIPAYGMTGAAIASIVPPVVATGIYLSVSQTRGKQALEMHWSRQVLAVIVAVMYCGVISIIAAGAGAAGALVSGLAVLVFPLVLVISGALAREEARRILEMLPLGRNADGDWVDRYALLGEEDHSTVEDLLRKRRPPAEIAEQRGEEVPELLRSLVGSLRLIGDIGTPGPHDAEIGRFLVSTKNAADRASDGQRIAQVEGVDSLEVDHLDELASRIAKASDKQWRDVTYFEESEMAEEGQSSW